MLKERQKSILDAAIQDYIETARPVASRDLVKKFRLGVSPATVRYEMLELDELGYLEQPHTSAGRIPTDRGYRIFVDELMSAFDLEADEEKLIAKTFAVKKEKEFVRELSKVISHISKTFVAVGIFEEEIFYERGLSEVFEEPEFANIQEHILFGKMVDSLEENVREIFENEEINEERFFIGAENPINHAKAYTMALFPWTHSCGFNGFVAMVGPKRTNYTKHRAIIKSIKKLSHG